MTSNKLTTTIVDSNIDEFGRDLSLKYKPYTSIFGNYLERFKGMSWAEMDYLLEEEEEEEKRKEEEEKRNIEREELRKELAARKKLYERGLYELEEGEELDL
jgi:hypothetical protein